MKIIGLDIGGTTVKGAVVDNGNIVYKTKFPTNANLGKDAIIETILKLIKKLEKHADENSPIGIGSAGDIDPIKGKVVFATDSLPNFTGLPLKAIIEKATGRSVSIVNDAIAALVGEIEYGGAKGSRNVVMLTLGTGLGGGITVNGKLLFGSNFQGAKIGHIPLHSNGRECKCGRSGCAEQYVSATALRINAAEENVDTTDCTIIFKKAMDNEVGAVKAVDKFLDDLICVIKTVTMIFDPEVVLLGGGLVEAKKYWWKTFEKKLDKKLIKIVKPAKLGNNAGFFGSQYIATNKNYL